MIALTRLRTLDLAEPAEPGRPSHLSAASGLLHINSTLYVVADDELHLGVFGETDNAPGRLIRLIDGVLPAGKADRKKRKPDFESLVLLPPHSIHSHGAILAVGSGSKKNRRKGALLPLDALGNISAPATIVDLSPLFMGLEEIFPALNIEGALVSGSDLCLFQRGNADDSVNAIIRFSLSAFFDTVARADGAPLTPSEIIKIDLGHIDGVPLGFTDATPLPDRTILFTAAAEDTLDTYNDGPCVGAGVGILDEKGTLLFFDALDAPHKIEGVAAEIDGSAIKLLLVTDADDADIAATLFGATVPAQP